MSGLPPQPRVGETAANPLGAKDIVWEWDGVKWVAAGTGVVDGNLLIGGDLAVNGAVNTGTINSTNPNGLSINGGIVVGPVPGGTDAGWFNGGVQINGALDLQGPLITTTVGGLPINGGIVVNPAPGQLDAALFNGDVQINGVINLNGQIVGFGGPDSGGPGYRMLIIAN